MHRHLLVALLVTLYLCAAAPAQDGPAAPGPDDAPAPVTSVDPGPVSSLDEGTVSSTSDAAVVTSAAPEPTVEVTRFELTGNVSIPTAELLPLVEFYVGQPCTLDMLREAAGIITDEYHRRGLTLGRAYIPAQEIAGGVVTIAVLEARIGRILVEGNENYSSEFVAEHLEAAMAESDRPSTDALEKGLLLLNDYKDLEVTTVLERGQEPGTVDVRAKVEDDFPLRLTLSYNNFGSEYVSRHRFGATLDWTNALIDGACLTLTGLVGEEPERLAFGAASYTVPLNRHGTRLGITGAFGNFQVSEDLDELDIHGEQLSGTLVLSHPFVRTRAFSLTGEAGVRYADSKFFLLDEEESDDRIRTAYLGALVEHVALRGRTVLSLNIAQGLGPVLGGLHKNDDDASRLDADNVFTRVLGQIARLQSLTDSVGLFGRVAGQWSSDSLVAAEEWQAGGADSVRGYGPGEAAGDHGYAMSLELRVSPLEDKSLLTLYGFVDHGGAYRKKTVVGQDDHEYLTGAGLGARSHIEWAVTIDLRLEVGAPIEPDDNALNELPVLYAAAQVRF